MRRGEGIRGRGGGDGGNRRGGGGSRIQVPDRIK